MTIEQDFYILRSYEIAYKMSKMLKDMNISKEVFRAYDIRGIVGEQIHEEFAYKLGQVFAQLLQQECQKKDLQIVIGKDMRTSSESLQQALMKGLIDSGVHVLDIGLVSTPAFYFAVGHLNADGGIMVSASHNPAKYNGFKMTRSKAVPIGQGSGMEILKQGMLQETNLSRDLSGIYEEVYDSIPKLATLAEIDFIKPESIRPFRIVADTANGMGAQYLDLLFSKIEADLIRLYWEFDGSFPNHEADPLKEENLAHLKKRVLEEKADIGIATDGDGDRVFFVTEKGEVVEPAIVRSILAEVMLRKFPGGKVCFDVRPGRIADDTVLLLGGKILRTPVGHAFIKTKMKEQGAIFAGESSGHYYYAFPQGFYEGPVTAIVSILAELTRTGKTLSELIQPKRIYAHSGEINFTIENKQEVIEAIVKYYRDGIITNIDGVSIEYPDFWLNVRASNTEPILRLNLEAKNHKIMEKRRDEMIGFIEQVGKTS